MIVNRHAKYHAIAVVPPNIIYSDATVVIAKESWLEFAIYSSNVHEAWAWFRGSTMGSSTLRFTPSTVFETFCEPENQLSLTDIGEIYHDHRRQLMLMLGLGLTKTYNLFHDPALSVEMVADESGKDDDIAREGYEGLVELRRLHVEMDNAVRDAYGWQDLDLGHGFHDVETLPENDRTRYTISPAARKEVLKRLLALNHERATEEAAKQTAEKGAKKKRGRKTQRAEQDNPLLAAGPLFDSN